LKTLRRGVIVDFSISTLNKRLAKILEQGAPKPEERLEAMRKCKEEGFWLVFHIFRFSHFIRF